MRRLKPECIERAEAFSHRVVDVAGVVLLRFPARRGWLPPERLNEFQNEAAEFRSILGATQRRTRQKLRKAL